MKSLEEEPLSINQDLKGTLNDLLKFPLIEAMAGRRSRRFCMGAEIPDGVLSFKSKHKPMPLSEVEQLLVLTAMGGVTGWHFAIMRHATEAFTKRKFGEGGTFCIYLTASQICCLYF
jgi:hypothetical protein